MVVLMENVAAINTTMQSSMGEIEQDLTTQLESVFSALCTKLHIPTDNPSSSSPPHTKGNHSSHSHNFQNHHFQCDLCLHCLDVTKFDGSDPTGWVTQMEHYFSSWHYRWLGQTLVWCSPSRSRTLAMVAMEKNFPSRVYCLDPICDWALWTLWH